MIVSYSEIHLDQTNIKLNSTVSDLTVEVLGLKILFNNNRETSKFSRTQQGRIQPPVEAV